MRSGTVERRYREGGKQTKKTKRTRRETKTSATRARLDTQIPADETDAEFVSSSSLLIPPGYTRENPPDIPHHSLIVVSCCPVVINLSRSLATVECTDRAGIGVIFEIGTDLEHRHRKTPEHNYYDARTD